MNKEDKIKEIIRELAAQFFSRVSNRLSLITVTDIEMHSRGSRATILITVLPESEEEVALEFVRRQLGEFREFVDNNSRIARIPFFDAKIDIGEKNRQKIDEIGRTI